MAGRGLEHRRRELDVVHLTRPRHDRRPAAELRHQRRCYVLSLQYVFRLDLFLLGMASGLSYFQGDIWLLTWLAFEKASGNGRVWDTVALLSVLLVVCAANYFVLYCVVWLLRRIGGPNKSPTPGIPMWLAALKWRHPTFWHLFSSSRR